jgi:hypothetical protein
MPSVSRSSKKRKSSVGNESGDPGSEIIAIKKVKTEPKQEVSMTDIDPALLAMGGLDALAMVQENEQGQEELYDAMEEVEMTYAIEPVAIPSPAAVNGEERRIGNGLASVEAISPVTAPRPTPVSKRKASASAVSIAAFELPGSSTTFRRTSKEASLGAKSSALASVSPGMSTQEYGLNSSKRRKTSNTLSASSKKGKRTVSDSIGNSMSPVMQIDKPASPTTPSALAAANPWMSPEEEASLKLVLQLQAEQFGLRRRGA